MLKMTRALGYFACFGALALACGSDDKPMSDSNNGSGGSVSSGGGGNADAASDAAGGSGQLD